MANKFAYFSISWNNIASTHKFLYYMYIYESIHFVIDLSVTCLGSDTYYNNISFLRISRCVTQFLASNHRIPNMLSSQDVDICKKYKSSLVQYQFIKKYLSFVNILKVFYSLSINIKSKISENTKKNQLASQKGDNHHVSIRHVFS